MQNVKASTKICHKIVQSQFGVKLRLFQHRKHINTMAKGNTSSRQYCKSLLIFLNMDLYFILNFNGKGTDIM